MGIFRRIGPKGAEFKRGDLIRLAKTNERFRVTAVDRKRGVVSAKRLPPEKSRSSSR